MILWIVITGFLMCWLMVAYLNDHGVALPMKVALGWLFVSYVLQFFVPLCKTCVE